jgi:hypothetical protein
MKTIITICILLVTTTPGYATINSISNDKDLLQNDLGDQLITKVSELNIYYLSSSDTNIVGNNIEERRNRRNVQIKKLFKEFETKLYENYKKYTIYKQQSFSCEGKIGKSVTCGRYMRVKKGDYEFFHGSIEVLDDSDGGLKAGPDLFAHSLHEITMTLGRAGEGINSVIIKAGVKYSESKIQKLIKRDLKLVRKRLKNLNLPDDKTS